MATSHSPFHLFRSLQTMSATSRVAQSRKCSQRSHTSTEACREFVELRSRSPAQNLWILQRVLISLYVDTVCHISYCVEKHRTYGMLALWIWCSDLLGAGWLSLFCLISRVSVSVYRVRHLGGLLSGVLQSWMLHHGTIELQRLRPPPSRSCLFVLRQSMCKVPLVVWCL